MLLYALNKENSITFENDLLICGRDIGNSLDFVLEIENSFSSVDLDIVILVGQVLDLDFDLTHG